MILACALGYYFHDEAFNTRPRRGFNGAGPRPVVENRKPEGKTPTPVPPYADLLMFSLLIVTVDTGLLLTKDWHHNEEDRIRLEQENTQFQLSMLRSQLSPHFFMNTLNNIYGLIDADTKKSKQAVMKLSKLMRYMLYENINGKVSLEKEFEFIRSYVDLMSIRFAEEIDINLDMPENFQETEIPAMLFISYIENAFKHGASYQQKSFIYVMFEIIPGALIFSCINSLVAKKEEPSKGGLGLENNKKRLDLLYQDKYLLSVRETEKMFRVELKIPLD
jgi:LytS/YehU family sensor histidine kinase